MYKLLEPTHIGVHYIVERLQEHISNVGHEKIQTLKGENVMIQFCLREEKQIDFSSCFAFQLPTVFVETLLDFHTKYLHIIRETFLNNSEFISALDKACTVIVNMKNPNRLSAKAPELVRTLI